MQEAPNVGQASAASSPSLVPIPPFRVRLFETGVGERLREESAKGISEAHTLQSIARERTALAAAIETEPFRAVFAQAYEQAHNTLQPQAPISAEQARRAIDDIIKNRANDARTLAQLVTQPDFIERAKNAPPKPAQFELPPEKITEMVARFTAEGSSYGIDARIHNQQAMAGHRVGHLALLQAFAENGPLQAPLAQALKAQLPDMDDTAIHALAGDWLESRREPAHAAAEALREGGAVYEAVMQRSDTPPVKATSDAAKPAPLAGAAARTATTGAMVTTPFMLQTTALTPAERESHKSGQQKAEDVMYTLNHAITCLSVTDLLIAPLISTASEKWFGKRVDICGHDHDHDHGKHHHHDDHDHDHDHGHGHGHGHDHGKKPFSKRFGNWVIGEAVGDIGAVAPTIALQRFAPGFMNGIRGVLEPMVGGFFRRGSNKAAQQWAEKNNLAPDNAQVTARAEELYEYEVSHLPQMAVWTLSSVVLNYLTMKFLDRDTNMGTFLKQKSAGAAITAGLVVSARAFSPNAAHNWDRTMGKHVVAPLTKLLGKPFGVEEKQVDDFARKRDQAQGLVYQGRLSAEGQTLNV